MKTVFKNVIKKHGIFLKKVVEEEQHPVGFKINQISFDSCERLPFVRHFICEQNQNLDMTTFENKIK